MECNLENDFYLDLNLYLLEEASIQEFLMIRLCYHLQIHIYLKVRTSFFELSRDSEFYLCFSTFIFDLYMAIFHQLYMILRKIALDLIELGL